MTDRIVDAENRDLARRNAELTAENLALSEGIGAWKMRTLIAALLLLVTLVGSNLLFDAITDDRATDQWCERGVNQRIERVVGRIYCLDRNEHELRNQIEERVRR